MKRKWSQDGGKRGGRSKKVKPVPRSSPTEMEEKIKSTSTVKWNPFTVFPKEIYLKIFDKVEDQTDKLNFMNAHKGWYELFKKKRTSFLFGKVLEVLLPTMDVVGPERSTVPEGDEMIDLDLHDDDDDEEEDDSDGEEMGWERDREEDEVSSEEERESSDEEDEMKSIELKEDEDDEDLEKIEISRTAILQLRLVCRGWDQGIQNYIQLHPSLFGLDLNINRSEKAWVKSPFSTNSNKCEISKSFWWRSANSLKKDLKRFKATHPPSSKNPKNPFLTRSITLKDAHRMCPGCGDRDRQNLRRINRGWCDQVNVLLEKYGEHIWHCKLILRLKLSVKTFVWIMNWLSKMPELRTLELEYLDGEPLSGRDLEKIIKIKDQVDSPALEKLMVLKCNQSVPAVAFNHIVERISALQALQIHLSGEKNKATVLRNYEMGQLENLQEAFFTLRGAADFHYLRGLRFPFMRKLVIDYVRPSSNIDVFEFWKWPAWKMVWSVLEEKFPSLEELDLRLPPACGNDSSSERLAKTQSLSSRLNLPNLKKLRVIMPNLSSLDWTLGLKGLKELEVMLTHDDWNSKDWRKLHEQEIIKFNRDLRTLKNSTIWKKLPKLKALQIKTRKEPVSLNYSRNYKFEKKDDGLEVEIYENGD